MNRVEYTFTDINFPISFISIGLYLNLIDRGSGAVSMGGTIESLSYYRIYFEKGDNNAITHYMIAIGI